MNKKIAYFIVTYKRPRSSYKYTYNALLKNNVPVEHVYCVCSNDDPTIPEYQEIYGVEKVLVFDKDSVKFDRGCLFSKEKMRQSVTYARNKCFEYAEELGYDYFCVLDDDIKSFGYRLLKEGHSNEKHSNEKHSNEKHLKTIKSTYFPFTNLIDEYCNILENTAIKYMTLWCSLMYLGGSHNIDVKRGYNDNAWVCYVFKTSKKVKFSFLSSEDALTCNYYNLHGEPVIAPYFGYYTPIPTSIRNEGGCSEIYDNGRYHQSCYMYLLHPNIVKYVLSSKGYLSGIVTRLSHSKTFPRIISEKYLKCLI